MLNKGRLRYAKRCGQAADRAVEFWSRGNSLVSHAFPVVFGDECSIEIMTIVF